MRKRSLTILAILAATIALAGCSKKLEGTYRDSTGVVNMDFKGSKVTMMGVELNYEIDGDKVKIATPNGPMTLNIQEDGSLKAALIGTLKQTP